MSDKRYYRGCACFAVVLLLGCGAGHPSQSSFGWAAKIQDARNVQGWSVKITGAAVPQYTDTGALWDDPVPDKTVEDCDYVGSAVEGAISGGLIGGAEWAILGALGGLFGGSACKTRVVKGTPDAELPDVQVVVAQEGAPLATPVVSDTLYPEWSSVLVFGPTARAKVIILDVDGDDEEIIDTCEIMFRELKEGASVKCGRSWVHLAVSPIY